MLNSEKKRQKTPLVVEFLLANQTGCGRQKKQVLP
jgi:hypothetical protein